MLFYSDLFRNSAGCTPSTSTCQHEKDLLPLSQGPVWPEGERQIDWVCVGMQSVYMCVGACAIMCVYVRLWQWTCVWGSPRLCVCGWHDVCLCTWTTGLKNSFSTNIRNPPSILYVCVGVRLYVSVLSWKPSSRGFCCTLGWSRVNSSLTPIHSGPLLPPLQWGALEHSQPATFMHSENH